MEKPYSQIHKLPILEKKIEASIQDALSAQKEKVREILDTVTKELENDLTDEKYSDDFKESVLRLFNVIKVTTENAEDCALVQSQLPIIDSLRVDAYKLRDDENLRIREEQQKLDDGKVIEEVEVTGRATKVINEFSFFKYEKMLKTEADIEKYVSQLKERLLTILEKENIRI